MVDVAKNSLAHGLELIINPSPPLCLQKFSFRWGIGIYLKEEVYLRLRRTPTGERIFKGFYEYSHGKKSYSEEEFEVYRNPLGPMLSFFSSIYARMATGEMLHIYVDYTVYKDYVPCKILIEKTLGKNYSREIYQHEKDKSLVNYFFISDDEEKHVEIPVTSRFHIAAPSAVSSMLFVQSRREGISEQTFFTLLTGKNKWSFEESPGLKSIVLYKPREKMESLKIGMETVSAHVYRLYEDTEGDNLNPDSPHLNVYMSQYFNIPYMFQSLGGGEIRIKKWEYITRT